MTTITTLKSLLAALAAQSSVTVTVPDETQLTRKIGPVEITVQLPSGRLTAKDLVEGITIKDAPDSNTPKQATTTTVPAKQAPAPVTTTTQSAPAVAKTQAPKTAPKNESAETSKSNDVPAKVSSLNKPSDVLTREITPQEKSYKGIWFDHTGRSAIKIDNCDDGLCGKIVWLKDSAHNSVCGVKIIGGGQKVGNVYDNGWIYDIDKGSKFDVELKLMSESKLRVLGYAGTKLLSKTMVWKRAPGNLELCS